MKPLNQNQFSLQWVATYCLLLVVYLGFFHSCIGASYQACITYGVCFWLAWMAICWTVRGVFLKRFEFGLYQLVGIDILFEGFVPDHTGYGFYWCAAGFWSVLLVYRLIPATKTVEATETSDVILAESVIPEPSN